MKVKLTSLASYKLELILDYLESEWSVSSRRKFLGNLNKKLTQISQNPKIYLASQIRPDVRKMIITKQNSAYYYIGKNEIVVITIFDNRQNQQKLLKEIKNSTPSIKPQIK